MTYFRHAKRGPFRRPPPGLDDYSTTLYTSGTTGTPKGVLFTHGRTGTSGAHFIEALGLTGDDVILAVTPLFHGNAWGAVTTALYAGCVVAFPVAFKASEFWPLVHEVQAKFQVPRLWAFRDALSKTPTQRVKKYKLRAEHGGGGPSLG